VSAVATFFATISVVEMIASPISGWLSDRYDRRSLATVADAMRACAAITLGVFLNTESSFWVIWISIPVFAACDRLSLTASQSMIPKVSDGYSPAVANSTSYFSMQVGSLAAAAAVGYSLSMFSPMVVTSAIACFFATSVFCMSCVFSDRTDNGFRENRPPPPLRIDAPLFRLCLVYCLLYACGLLISAVGPSLVLEELQGNALDFGHFESAWSVGSIVGSVLLIPLFSIKRLARLEIVALWVTAIVFASLKVFDFPWILVAICIVGASYNLGKVAIEMSLQSIVPCMALGRAKGVLHGSAVAIGVIMLGLIAIAGTSVSPTTIFLIFSLVITLCTALLLRLLR
jgi:MFS family permease